MNKAFTKTKELILDEKYKIIPDSDYGVILIHLTEKENKKGEIVPYEQKYYFTRIAQALRKYADLSMNKQNEYVLLINKMDELHSKIDFIDETFKQF